MHTTEEVGATIEVEARLARRFNAIRGRQAKIDREIRICLAELSRLRKDALDCTSEPEERAQEEQNCTNDLSPCTSEPNERARNEPKTPLPANDDAASAPDTTTLPTDLTVRNEPDAEQVQPWLVALQAATLAMPGTRCAIGLS